MSDKTIQYYEDNCEDYIRSTLDLDMSAFYLPFLQCIPPNGKILDAGCGSGRDALAFSKMGYRVSAFDASKAMAENASRSTGIEIKCMKFQELSWNNEFDGIWCCASLLHIPSSEISGVFDRLIRSLCPDGILYMSFKYGTCTLESDQRMFTCFTESSLKKVLDDFSQIKVKDIWITKDLRSGREDEKWCNALIQKLPK